MWWFDLSQKTTPTLRLGTLWKKKSETLAWTLTSIDEDTVTLSGPGSCKGIIHVNKVEFSEKWTRY